MAVTNSSENQETFIDENYSQSLKLSILQFAQKFTNVMHGADSEIKCLIQEVDKLIDSMQETPASSIEPVQERKKDFFSQQKSSQNKRDRDLLFAKQQKVKIVHLGNLSKKKQGLMNKLRQVDRELVACEFEAISSSRKLKQIQSRKVQKQSLKLIQQKAKPSCFNSVKPQQIVQNANRTLQLMDQLNRQKIKRHQELIKRMQMRQQQEIKKIQELEQRRTKIQLKKARLPPPQNNKLIKIKSQAKPIR